MRTLVDLDDAPVFAVPLTGGGAREGMLLEGPQGWGEFGPAASDGDESAARWLTSAMEAGTVGWPDPLRGRIPVAVTVPAVDPGTARRLVSDSGCATAVVAVDGPLPDAVARVSAVREALGPGGAIRCDARGGWDVDTAVTAAAALQAAAGALQYVEQPCRTREETAAVRRRLEVPIAADASMRDTADIVVLRCGPLGGVRRALRVADACGLPCVVASDGETSIGLAAGLALAGALPELPFACALGTRLLLGGDVVAGPRSLVPVDGFLPVSPMPPAPERGLLERYALDDGDRIAWWRDRLRRAAALV